PLVGRAIRGEFRQLFHLGRASQKIEIESAAPFVFGGRRRGGDFIVGPPLAHVLVDVRDHVAVRTHTGCGRRTRRGGARRARRRGRGRRFTGGVGRAEQRSAKSGQHHSSRQCARASVAAAKQSQHTLLS